MDEDSEVFWPVGEFPEVALNYFEAQEILQLRAQVAKLQDRITELSEHSETLSHALCECVGNLDTARTDRDIANAMKSGNL